MWRPLQNPLHWRNGQPGIISIRYLLEEVQSQWHSKHIQHESMACDQFDSVKEWQRDIQLHRRHRQLHSIHFATSREWDIRRGRTRTECQTVFGKDPTRFRARPRCDCLTIASICNPAEKSTPSIKEPIEQIAIAPSRSSAYSQDEL